VCEGERQKGRERRAEKEKERESMGESENLVFELDSIGEISWSSCLYLPFIASLMCVSPPHYYLFSQSNLLLFFESRLDFSKH
jgi:hypothetical protein